MATVIALSGVALPTLIAEAGEEASQRFIEFFTVNIRNPYKRVPYTLASVDFLCWCEELGILQLQDVQAFHVVTYIEHLQCTLAASAVQQHLTCIWMLLGWLVKCEVIPTNPAQLVRGMLDAVSDGSTPKFSSKKRDSPNRKSGIECP